MSTFAVEGNVLKGEKKGKTKGWGKCIQCGVLVGKKYWRKYCRPCSDDKRIYTIREAGKKQ